MTSKSAEVRRRDGAQAEASGWNPERAAVRVEMESVAGTRTKAESNGLMEAVCERGNLWSAYERVVGNKGAAGVDGIGRLAFKTHLQQHWPAIKARLLAGTYTRFARVVQPAQTSLPMSPNTWDTMHMQRVHCAAGMLFIGVAPPSTGQTN